MQLGTKVGIGIGAASALLVGGALFTAARAQTSPGDDPRPAPDPYPGGGTSPGDEPLRMPVRGRVDPPGPWNSYDIEGSLRGNRLDARMDQPGWGTHVDLRGRVDWSSFRTEADPAGFGNTTHVDGQRTGDGFRGTVDRPGLWNDVNHVIAETTRGAYVTRVGRFDEPLVPSFSEASWRSVPNGIGIEGRTLEFDPPGWGNTTRVMLEANVPAGVEATVAAALYDEWKTEQERQADYPDPGYPSGPSHGDDHDPSGPSHGDDPWAPGLPGDYPSVDDYPIV